LSVVKLFEDGQLVIQEVGVGLVPVPAPNEQIQVQGLRECRLLFLCAAATKGQQLCLTTMSAKINKKYHSATHQVLPESLHHLPNIPIFQPLSDLRIVVVCSAANLRRGQRGGQVAHGEVLGVWCGVVMVRG
jgi:hypothetical protein